MHLELMAYILKHVLCFLCDFIFSCYHYLLILMLLLWMSSFWKNIVVFIIRCHIRIRLLFNYFNDVAFTWILNLLTFILLVLSQITFIKSFIAYRLKRNDNFFSATYYSIKYIDSVWRKKMIESQLKNMCLKFSILLMCFNALIEQKHMKINFKTESLMH